MNFKRWYRRATRATSQFCDKKFESVSPSFLRQQVICCPVRSGEQITWQRYSTVCSRIEGFTQKKEMHICCYWRYSSFRMITYMACRAVCGPFCRLNLRCFNCTISRYVRRFLIRRWHRLVASLRIAVNNSCLLRLQGRRWLFSISRSSFQGLGTTYQAIE